MHISSKKKTPINSLETKVKGSNSVKYLVQSIIRSNNQKTERSIMQWVKRAFFDQRSEESASAIGHSQIRVRVSTIMWEEMFRRARREQLFRTFPAHVATHYAQLTRKNHSGCKSEPCTRGIERTGDQRRVRGCRYIGYWETLWSIDMWLTERMFFGRWCKYKTRRVRMLVRRTVILSIVIYIYKN